MIVTDSLEQVFIVTCSAVCFTASHGYYKTQLHLLRVGHLGG